MEQSTDCEMEERARRNRRQRLRDITGADDVIEESRIYTGAFDLPIDERFVFTAEDWRVE